MAFPVSHKTVFVLDHSPHFQTSCQQSIEFDIFTKTRQPGIIPLAPIAKSLWTCTLEAISEYCRIVWDIFPTGKLMRFVVSDTTSHVLNTWDPEEQNLGNLLSILAQVGSPSDSVDPKECNVIHGLTAAIAALCQCSEIQHEKRTSMTEIAGKIVNRGRVICITAGKSDSHLHSLEECFLDALVEHNKMAAGSDSLMPVHFCELVLIHTVPVLEESAIKQVPRRELSSVLSSEIHVVKSGRHIAFKLVSLVQHHYGLSSTTVTGIPMKEEQNANSSANYDVELLHPSAAHAELYKTGFINTEGVHVSTCKEGEVYETITLKWCTPRSSSIELHYCMGAQRISPVDVNSRPSSCLTNFLLGGRAVMLEMPRKSGSKVLSHMLASHGGEIYIHTLATSRSILEDPPSISEGCGGRVTDYRINDFGEFMKESKLVPYKHVADSGSEAPIERAKHCLKRVTQYWPMVISHTTIFNMTSHLDPLLNLVMKESITTDEVVECKKVIYQLVGMESKGTSLPVPTMGTRGKGPKKEEQYRMMWNELETFVRMHCLTPEHRSVLECLLECRKPSGEGDSSPNSKAATSSLGGTVGKKTTPERLYGKDEKPELGKLAEIDQGWKEIDRGKSDSEKPDFAKDDIRLPTLKKMKTNQDDLRGGTSAPQSLLSLWTSKIEAEHAKHHVEFSGRANAGNGVAKLYPNLNVEGNAQSD